MHARPWDSKHTKVQYGVSIVFVFSNRNADVERTKARRAQDSYAVGVWPTDMDSVL